MVVFKQSKTLIGIGALLLFALLCAHPAPALSAPFGKSSIVDIRAGEHKEFHRFVIELSAPAEYSLMRRPGHVSIRLRGVEPGMAKGRVVKTSLLRLKSVAVRKGRKGAVTVLDIEFDKGMKVEQYSESKPFRIIIDIYRKKSASRYRVDEGVRSVKRPTRPSVAPEADPADNAVATGRKVAKSTETVRGKRAEKGGKRKKSVKNTPQKLEDAVKPEAAAKAVSKTPSVALRHGSSAPAATGAGSLSVKGGEKNVSSVADNGKGAQVVEQKSTEPGPVARNQPEPYKPEPDKAKTVKAETVEAKTVKAKTTKSETTKPETTKSETTKSETTKAEKVKPETTKAEKVKAATVKDAGRRQAAKKRAAPQPAGEGDGSKAPGHDYQDDEEHEAPVVLSGKMITIGKHDTGAGIEKLKKTVLSLKRLEREEAKRELLASRPESMSGTLDSLVAYNEGWRFIYRMKTNKLIQAELYRKDVVEWKVFRDVLVLAAFEPGPLAKEATALSVKLAANGKSGRAAVVASMAKMIEGGGNPEELAGLLRIYPESGLTHLGWLILGGYYEKHGFYPEALGHYARVVNESNEGRVKSAAHFARARLLYLTGEFTKSRVSFRRLLATGYKQAGMWLGNAYHMRGETDRARALYEKYVPVELGSVDPITLMGVGDLRIRYGDYTGAAEVFKFIQENDSIKELAMAFLRVREADALMLKGEPVKAQVIYTGAYKAFTGEARILSGLALADSMAMVDKGDSLMRAESFYHRLHRGSYVASQYAYLNMARVQLRLKLYRDAAIALDDFLEYYPTNAQRGEALDIKADVMFEWIKSLFAKSDYFGVVDAVSRYGASIPFGKKGSTYYRIGKSYSELSLLSEAVGTLRASLDVGVDRVAERSMLELANVYLKQKDAGSVERLAKNFKARFPKSANMAQLDTILSKAAYIKGDYRAYAKGGSVTGEPATDFNRASALARLKRHREAVELFLGVARAYKAGGDLNGEKRALLGAADSSFRRGGYTEAVKQYNGALNLMGKESSLERRWALYMITQSYSRLKKRELQKEALDNVVVANGVFGEGAEAIYRDDFRR